MSSFLCRSPSPWCLCLCSPPSTSVCVSVPLVVSPARGSAAPSDSVGGSPAPPRQSGARPVGSLWGVVAPVGPSWAVNGRAPLTCPARRRGERRRRSRGQNCCRAPGSPTGAPRLVADEEGRGPGLGGRLRGGAGPGGGNWGGNGDGELGKVRSGVICGGRCPLRVDDDLVGA